MDVSSRTSGICRALPEQIRQHIRSSIALSSVVHCVEELVHNALDAEAKTISISVNLSTFRIKVDDDGCGIGPTDLAIIGTRYTTSKCSTLADLQNLRSYGYRGEALANILQLSSSIEFYTRQDQKVYHRKLKDSSSNHVSNVSGTKKPSKGTTVIVNGYLSKAVVRQKRVDKALEMEEIQGRLEAIALINPKISFTLKNDELNRKLLQISCTNSTKDVFRNLYGFKYGMGGHNLLEISAVYDVFYLAAFISTQLTGTKAYQHVYVNKRLVSRCHISRKLNELFIDCLTSKGGGKGHNGNSDVENKKKYPVFMVNIQCSVQEYDITLEPRKQLVEFKKKQELTTAAENLAKRLKAVLASDSRQQDDRAIVEKSKNHSLDKCYLNEGPVGRSITTHAIKRAVHSRAVIREDLGQSKLYQNIRDNFAPFRVDNDENQTRKKLVRNPAAAAAGALIGRQPPQLGQKSYGATVTANKPKIYKRREPETEPEYMRAGTPESCPVSAAADRLGSMSVSSRSSTTSTRSAAESAISYVPSPLSPQPPKDDDDANGGVIDLNLDECTSAPPPPKVIKKCVCQHHNATGSQQEIRNSQHEEEEMDSQQHKESQKRQHSPDTPLEGSNSASAKKPTPAAAAAAPKKLKFANKYAHDDCIIFTLVSQVFDELVPESVLRAKVDLFSAPADVDDNDEDLPPRVCDNLEEWSPPNPNLQGSQRHGLRLYVDDPEDEQCNLSQGQHGQIWSTANNKGSPSVPMDQYNLEERIALLDKMCKADAAAASLSSNLKTYNKYRKQNQNSRKVQENNEVLLIQPKRTTAYSPLDLFRSPSPKRKICLQKPDDPFLLAAADNQNPMNWASTSGALDRPSSTAAERSVSAWLPGLDHSSSSMGPGRLGLSHRQASGVTDVTEPQASAHGANEPSTWISALDKQPSGLLSQDLFKPRQSVIGHIDQQRASNGNGGDKSTWFSEMNTSGQEDQSVSAVHQFQQVGGAGKEEGEEASGQSILYHSPYWGPQDDLFGPKHSTVVQPRLRQAVKDFLPAIELSSIREKSDLREFSTIAPSKKSLFEQTNNSNRNTEEEEEVVNWEPGLDCQIITDTTGNDWLETKDSQTNSFTYVNVKQRRNNTAIKSNKQLTANEIALLSLNQSRGKAPGGSTSAGAAAAAGQFYNMQRSYLDGQGRVLSKNGNLDLLTTGRSLLSNSVKEMIGEIADRGGAASLASNKWRFPDEISKNGELNPSGGGAEVGPEESYSTYFSENWEKPLVKNGQLPLANLASNELNFTWSTSSSSWPTSRSNSRSFTFRKEDLGSVEVIGQADHKFIAGKITALRESEVFRILVLFDQHAVHERIRLEALQASVYEDLPATDVPNGVDVTSNSKRKRLVTANVMPAIRLNFNESEIQILKTFQHELEYLGLELTIIDQCSVHVGKVPMCFVEKISTETMAARDESISRLTHTLIQEQLSYIMETKQPNRSLPKTIFNLLCSQACHGAIKFGDYLSTEACTELMKSLEKCQLPFQCAHGRPCVIPIINLE